MKYVFKMVFQVLAISSLFFFLPQTCQAYSFNSYNIGGTTFYSGDVTGSAYSIGNTTFYNLNGQNYSSYKIGDTTFYSGNGLNGSSYNIGGTTFSNFGGSRINSYTIGGTTFYSGDVTGSSYNIGGMTNFHGTTNVGVPTFYKPLNTTTYTYPSYNYNPYLYQHYLTPSPTVPPTAPNNFFSNILTFLLNLFGLSKLQPTPTPSPVPTIGLRTKTSGCEIKDSLPDKACTPGAVFPRVTKEEICQSGYSSKVRSVSQSTKNEVYKEYGITSHKTGEYEVDHLISLDLGGSNDVANLWPEPAEPRPGFHEKDKVENYLHKLLCDGIESLRDVQYQIANNWLGVYATLPNK